MGGHHTYGGCSICRCLRTKSEVVQEASRFGIIQCARVGVSVRHRKMDGHGRCPRHQGRGNTITEAASLGLPMLLLRPIPGQEHANASYAVAKGLAQLFYSSTDIQRVIAEMVARSGNGIRVHARMASRDLLNASIRVAELLLNPERANDSMKTVVCQQSSIQPWGGMGLQQYTDSA